jgi:hypothetical protein
MFLPVRAIMKCASRRTMQAGCQHINGAKMSSRQLDERYDEEHDARLAEHLGLTVDELGALEPEIDTNESADGLIYSYILNFPRDAPKELLAKVIGLAPDSLTMQLALGIFNSEDRDDEF